MPRKTRQSTRTQHLEDSDAAFAKIDKDVAVLKERIRILALENRDTALLEERVRALYGLRNTFTFVYRLPLEDLTRIFYFARHIPTYDTNYVKRPRISWVAMSQVSQLWRRVAIGSPNVWAHLSSSYPNPIIQEWLKRSGSVGLKVDWYRTTSQDAQFFQSSLHRMKELTLTLKSNRWNILFPKLSAPALQLETLSIAVESCDTGSPIPVIITDSIFSGSTPCLERVYLSGCSVDPGASLLTNLTSLRLWNPPQKFSARALLAILHNLPRLTSLGFSEVLKPSSSLIAANSGTVTFPSLQSLFIKGDSFSQYLDILSHLSFPKDSALEFRSKTEFTSAIPSLLEFLRVNQVVRWSSSTPLVDTMDLDSSRGTIKLSLNLDSTKPGYVANLMKLELRGEWKDRTLMPDDVMIASCFACLPLTDLRSLTSNWSLDAEAWASAFGSLPNLKCVHARTRESIKILDTIVDDFKTNYSSTPAKKLQNKKARTKNKKEKKKRGEAQVATSSASSSDYDPIFPKLEELRFSGPTFIRWVPDDFVDALLARKKVGKGLVLLKIDRCEGTSRRVVDELSEVVKVKWDGYTGKDNDDDDADTDLYADGDCGLGDYILDDPYEFN